MKPGAGPSNSLPEVQTCMLRAIIFDFDGVIVDSEPAICDLTQQIATQQGWRLTKEEYYRDYLALDDRGIVEHLFATRGGALDLARRDELIQWKAKAYAEMIRAGLPQEPGACEFVRRVAGQFPLAIASGSSRVEVETLLTNLGLRELFPVLATAEDFEKSKPDPTVFRKALERLNRLPNFKRAPLAPGECLTIEDAPLGIVAAHAAGMKCLALAHTRPLEALRGADWTARGFAEVDMERIRAAFE